MLELSLQDRNGATLLRFQLNLESFETLKTWVVSSLDHMGRIHRKRECRPHEGDAGCFLTTATVGAVGLTDNCWELRSLRRFRDRVLTRSEGGRALIEEYYRIAPEIVAQIERRVDRARIWRRAYLFGVVPAALLSRLGLEGAALWCYRRMTLRLLAKTRRASCGSV